MIEAVAATLVLTIFGALVATALVLAGGAASRRRAKILSEQHLHLLYMVKHVEQMANAYKDVEPGAAAIAAYLESEKQEGLY